MHRAPDKSTDTFYYIKSLNIMW